MMLWEVSGIGSEVIGQSFSGFIFFPSFYFLFSSPFGVTLVAVSNTVHKLYTPSVPGSTIAPV